MENMTVSRRSVKLFSWHTYRHLNLLGAKRPWVYRYLGHCRNNDGRRHGSSLDSWHYMCPLNICHSKYCVSKQPLLIWYHIITLLSQVLNVFIIPFHSYPKPIRGSMTAATLRSSEWNRCPRAFEILDSEDSGRIRIFVVQFQGHLFFGYAQHAFVLTIFFSLTQYSIVPFLFHVEMFLCSAMV